ncbi:ribonuclease T2 [Mycena rosella]|uniref:Ribonuclease T2-like n=1 Tax=Mycena rosella TaxID=1033263 RepID=A0AAD7CNN2_MYCRO|nr:ribonuclease T2 [Mycena rosella]
MLALTLLAGLVGSSLASPFFSPWNSEELFKRAADISSGCSSTGTASCTNTTAVSNQCCFQAPGGQLLQTQFWDTSPTTGPSNSWTIHGLWPDHCDGTFDSTCDPSRAYTDLGGLLTAQGSSDTLDFMNTYWKDIDGSDESFWEHEWSKHGTCMSTLDVKCLPSGSAKGAEAVIFFNTVVRLFKTLPTYEWLADAGITPSSSTTHTLASLTAALKKGYGFTPALDCTSGAVNQISYYYHLKGSVIDGTFVPIDAPIAGSCPSTGIKYLTKTGSPVTTTGTSTKTTTTKTTTTKTTTGTKTSTTTSAPTGIPTKATIHAMQDGAQVGGLLSLGTWSTQTLASYTLTGTAKSFTLTTSKGSCGVSSGVFACGSGVTSTKFSAVTSGNLILLASDGETNFSSDDVPSGSTAYSVNTGGDDSEVYTLSIVSA